MTEGAFPEWHVVKQSALRGPTPGIYRIGLKPPDGHSIDRPERRVAGKQIRNQTAADGSEADAHHRMTAGDQEIWQSGNGTEVRHSVR